MKVELEHCSRSMLNVDLFVCDNMFNVDMLVCDNMFNVDMLVCDNMLNVDMLVCDNSNTHSLGKYKANPVNIMF
jgi:hypothetical protein